METKIIDINDNENSQETETKTVILDNAEEDNNSGTVIIESEDTTGTVIIENQENSGTVILDNSENTEESTGTVILENNEIPKPENSENQPIQQNQPLQQEIQRKFSGEALTTGTTVDCWTIKSQMNTNSGEADLFLATKDDVTYVFKYYKGKHKPKSQVVEKIKNLKSKNIVKLLDYGFYNERFFEVYEYAQFGNINKKKKNGDFKYLPLNEETIFSLCKDIVETFNEFHSVGIIHRDIKPENFMLRKDSPLEILVGDFGIASVMEQNEELHKTKTQSHTVGYVPREFFTADFKGIGKGIDYYSLGITLWEFATGANPFANPENGKQRNENHILRDTFEGRLADDLLSRKTQLINGQKKELPILSEKLQKLIRGLLVTDYNKRWGYSEVTRYLNGENVDVVETQIQKIKVSIDGVTYDDEKKLATALWQNKESVTFSTLSKIADALLDIHSYIAEDVQAIVQDITDKNDLVNPLLKIMYRLNPESSFEIGYGFSITNKDDILYLLENAPEVIAPSFENLNSTSFTYISLILGEDLTKSLIDLINKQKQNNEEFYDSCDNLFMTKIIKKAKILIDDKLFKPFKSEDYKNVSLSELTDLESLNKEQRQIVEDDLSMEIYEDYILPWIEVKLGKDISEIPHSSWYDFANCIGINDGTSQASI